MGRAELTNPQHRLPALSLVRVPEGVLQPVRLPGRRAPVVVLLHGSGCAPCRAYVALLASVSPSLQEWDGYVRLVLPESLEDARRFHAREPLPFAVLADPEQRLAGACRAAPPAVVIADQWGEVHSCACAGPAHAWPAPSEVVAWLRFLAVRCPECEGEAL